ncbi:glycosyltransferase family 92 protein [Mucilaginibacter kameinonensis]|uniref:glycosyltransferase family 92 protein n=1 Tax=Mucilaginibacter kameinonensis TaxID=452286 RepID=UPI000EF7595B|nr:glycosyltransferase family 92 protein [Mucilaginibacter kameinonensis]
MRVLKYFSKPKQNYKLAICAIIRDENAYLEEWIKYHLLIGVEHFFMYDNESKVPVKTTLKALGLAQYATVRKIRGEAQQMNAYNDCVKRYGESAQWIAFIDIDEYIVPKIYPYNLPDFLEDYKDYGGININWAVFGSSGHKKRTNKPQLESFILRSETNFYKNRHTKCIIQPKFADSCHNPHYFNYKNNKFAVNENFKPVVDAFSDVSVDKILINHYYCRSEEEYLEKITRGAGDSVRVRKMDDFHEHNDETNIVEDTLILEIIKTKTQDQLKMEPVV